MAKHRRGPWTQHEDTVLLQLVQQQGAHNWVQISQLIGSRSPKQCRERYHQNLKPSLNLDPISPEEGAMIEQLVNEMGKRWADIARRLRGRSDNAVKNWWNGGMNRRKRLDNRRHTSGHEIRILPTSSTTAPPYDSKLSTYSAQQQQQQQQPQQSQHHQGLHPQSSHSHGSLGSNAQPKSFPQAPLRQIEPMPFGPSSRRIDAPLPSPSSFSTSSRAESIDSAAPSLVSDSYSSYSSYSPRQPSSPSSVELSGLNSATCYSSISGPARSSSSASQPPYVTGYAQADDRHRERLTDRPLPPPLQPHSSSSYSQQERTQPLLHPPLGRPLPTPSPSSSSTQAYSRPEQGSSAGLGAQLPLPSFLTRTPSDKRHSPLQSAQQFTAPESKDPQPVDNQKDVRMSLSSLLS